MSKHENFPERQQELAALAKALAHPARIAILEQLAADDDCRGVELELPLARPTVAQHLEALAEAGLIRGSYTGRNLCYCLDRDALSALTRRLGGFLAGLERPASGPVSCDPGCC